MTDCCIKLLASQLYIFADDSARLITAASEGAASDIYKHAGDIILNGRLTPIAPAIDFPRDRRL